MQDVIKLLPDSIANQIAAGEVIQRPASVVKELIENAIDAGSTSVKLIVKDAGKTLIQVIDDGKGMSETDARMSFERHATSKIATANDLFSIRTMGFRGEALASIAAIAHVEMITRQHHSDIGTRILIEGTTVLKQESVQASAGTSIAVKNLFFNVPARRKFLKSDPVEFRHIMDEFHRVALAHPDIFFSLFHNGNEIYHLPISGLKQRIINILGKNMTDKLLQVNEETELVNFSGYTVKSEAAKKHRVISLFLSTNVS
jgi:DNA mismatch repair protein MutL